MSLVIDVELCNNVFVSAKLCANRRMPSNVRTEVPRTLQTGRMTLSTRQPRLYLPWQCSSSTTLAPSVSSVSVSVGAAVTTSLA